MKNIRTKITVPFLVTIIIVPLITMILFNIALRIYFAKNAVKELKNTVSAVETFIRNQMKDDDFSDGKIQTMLGSLKPILKASRLAANTELILFNKNLEVVYPSNPKSTDTFITDSLISGIRSILPSSEKNKVYTIRVGRIRYMAVGSRLVQSSLPRSSYVVFVTPVNSGSSAIRTFNIILLLILFIAVLICSFIAFGVSKSISKPIVKLCGYAGRIGRGEFIKVPPDRSSKEINDLCLSMNEMSEQLLNSTNTQRTFLQNASHEFRTPLMSIQGYAEGIIKGVFPDAQKAAGIICNESKRLNTLVEELLTLSHIENGVYKSEMANINLPHMMMEYIQRINGLALKENKEIRSDMQGENISVYADDNLLSQAVTNVISNCIRYAKAAVTVSVYEKENSAFIRIRDDGEGIDKADLPHIFDRFYKGKKGNFGLGLSIAKLAVEHMGGTIEAYSKPEGGEFIISLQKAV